MQENLSLVYCYAYKEIKMERKKEYFYGKGFPQRDTSLKVVHWDFLYKRYFQSFKFWIEIILLKYGIKIWLKFIKFQWEKRVFSNFSL